MSNILNAIRDAVRPGSSTHALDIAEDMPGASAPSTVAPPVEANSSGDPMSATQTMAGAAQAATGVAAAVVAAAAAPSANTGFKAATDRMSAILGADGIKGDGKRMAAALDLATASPDMAADAIVAFVTANVASAATASAPAASAGANANSPPAATYEQQRLAAAALATPGGAASAAAAGPKISSSAIFSMRRNALKGD